MSKDIGTDPIDIAYAANLPAAVKTASTFLITSALWMLIVGSIASGRLITPALLPTVMMGVISFGLLWRRRWAWWSAMVLGCLWLTGGLIALTGLVSKDASNDLRMFVILVAGVPVMLLASALSLLVRADSRALFRRAV
jgi:hypothetical protein